MVHFNDKCLTRPHAHTRAANASASGLPGRNSLQGIRLQPPGGMAGKR